MRRRLCGERGSGGLRDGRKIGGNDWFMCFDEVFAYSAQDWPDPEDRGFLIVDPKENGLRAGGRDEFAQLGAGELKKG